MIAEGTTLDGSNTTLNIAQSFPAPEFRTGASSERHMNDKVGHGRLHFFLKLVQTSLLRPITRTALLSCRVVKLSTWVLAKTGVQKISGYHTESATYFKREYLKTIKAARDVLFIPSVWIRAFKDTIVTREEFFDDIEKIPTQNYLNVNYTSSFQPFSSYLHGRTTFEVISPGIAEFAATNDPSLKTIMASHVFKPGMMAINFGSPNVAAFITKEAEDGSVETIKVDAKSLKREPMGFHPTHGKIQSGVFLVPTNLPVEALERFQQAAKKLQGSRDITCVNTNCRVLQEAGFSIEGVAMDGIIFPQTLAEHLLFRNVFYTDSNGVKHKVHFDILNTTQNTLEKHFEDVDTAVVGTRLRHRERRADTEENQRIRGAAAKAIIAEEELRLATEEPVQPVNDEGLERRKVTVSVPSCLGNTVASIWGRHTIYEVDLSNEQREMADAFNKLAAENGETAVKLRPFPQEKPGFVTRLKRDIFFSGPMIRFLRRHMMGRVDEINLHAQDLFRHLRSTKGAHLNYVFLNDRVVLGKVRPNADSQEKIKKTADWALSKHALLAGRQEVYCAGEIWYDEQQDCFMMNDDSGTYLPTPRQVEVAARLANKFFSPQRISNAFRAVSAHPKEEAGEVELN